MALKHESTLQRGSPQAALAGAIAARATRPGDFDTAVPNLSLFRRDSTSPPTECMVEPSIVLVVQGLKQVWVGGESFAYDAKRFLITSLDVPANSEVVAASKERPCLGLTLKLDMHVLADLMARGQANAPCDRSRGRGVGVGTSTMDLLYPFVRLLDLLDDPEAIPVLAPLIEREIHYRLLRSDQAARLQRIASVDGQGYRISKAVDWLKANFAVRLRVEELAARVQMSTPTFHQHFRQLTAMSPLQYQKWLRLNEAKRLMLNEHLDAASAAFRVGYESPSQFSREYSRSFGAPPKRDIAVMRAQAEQLDLQR
ncbi:AraC family transcriptional regulator N-terminal domain-containing protein [Paraburkholderia sp. RCC_158]|uniref:AraC family transcriptional regulator n=1 Tax=Paraburkholderia sp. RCC_158 TaxID=3239220 RepID=UPI00352472F3